MRNFMLSKKNTGLLIIDVQEKLLAHVDRSTEVLSVIQQLVKGFQILNLPIVVTEQYPEGLGATVNSLKNCLQESTPVLSKTSFSCLGDSLLKQKILEIPVEQWVLVGIEAHVCILQSAKDLLACGKEIVVPNNATSSRSIYDFSTAIAEMRDCGVRISCSETILFELLKDSKAPEFKAISMLIK